MTLSDNIIYKSIHKYIRFMCNKKLPKKINDGNVY